MNAFEGNSALPEGDAPIEALPRMVDGDRISADAELRRSFEGAVA